MFIIEFLMTKLALGTVQFGLNYGINIENKQTSPSEAKKILNYAHSKGIKVLDTANSYGESEKIIGMTNLVNLKVITKTRHFKNNKIDDNDAKLLNDDFNKSLKNLNRKSVYGVLIHNPNDLLKPKAEKLFNQLINLKRKKKVRKIGVSVYDHIQLETILNNYDIDLVQLPFNIFDRRMADSGMLSKLKNKKIEIHARSIFLQGLLLMPEKKRPIKFNSWKSLWKLWHEWLNDNKITPLEASIKYVISRSEISKAVVGVNTKIQLEEIFNSLKNPLPQIPVKLSSNDVALLNPSNWDKL